MSLIQKQKDGALKSCQVMAGMISHLNVHAYVCNTRKSAVLVEA